MHEWMKVRVKKGDKIIIGLGDSFTQGVGAYSDETYAKHNHKIPVFVSDKPLIKEQYEGSWVNQLCVNHMPEWKPVNLGHAGTGNRCAVKELYLHSEIGMENASEAIVILFLSGMERFDFINRTYSEPQHHFEAMWPNHWDPNASKPNLWKAYAEDIYSEQFIAMELMLNILEAQMFCKARGWKLIVANAFDIRINQKWLKDKFAGAMKLTYNSHVTKTIDSFDWKTFYYPKKMLSLLEYLLDLEGNRELAPGAWFRHYTELAKPSTYITNCGHPTIKGHAEIAKLFYEHIVKQKLYTI
jgi:hypothetical protein